MNNFPESAKKKYLSEDELETIFKNCDNLRDKLLCMMSYKHGLRCQEAINLSWDDIKFNKDASIFVRRVKSGISSEHPLFSDEMRMLKRLKKLAKSPYVFESRLGSRMSGANVRALMKKIALRAKIPGLHHHQFRHSCGFHMAKKGIEALMIKKWMGHRKFENTMIYIDDAAIDLKKLRDWV